MEEHNKPHRLDKFSFGLIFILGFILPLFFLPVPGLPVEAAKGILVALVTLVAFSFWVLSRLIDGAFVMPRSPIFIGAFALLVASFLSSIFSDVSMVSLIGRGFETDTFAFLLVALLLLFLSATFFQSGERVFYFYGALLAAALVTALYHIIRLVAGADTLSFGMFGNPASSPIGKWNDLAIFFGGVGMLALVTAELLTLPRRLSFLLYALIAVSLFFLALINFSLVWLVVGVLSIVLVVYGVYINREVDSGEASASAPTLAVRRIRLPVASIVVALISFLFFLSSASLGVFLSNKLGISQLEVRPSFATTIELAKTSLSDKMQFFFGSGPNRFSSQWLLNKPDGINESPFWNADFNNGFGIVPSALVTGGVLGALAWVVFLSLFAYAGFRALFAFSLSRPSRYLVVSSFLFASYLWTFVVLYVPNITLYVLAFIMTGIVIATLTSENLSGRYSLNLLGDPKTGFVSVLLLIFFLIGGISLGYFFTQKFVSQVYFQKSLAALNIAGSVVQTETYLGKALAFSNDDLYHRALSELDLIKLNALLQQTNVPQDTLRAQFQTILGQAIDSAKKATEIDKTNYSNFLSLGRVYEAIVPLNIPGSYDAAKEAYQAALARNPESPAILLNMARLEVARSNNKEGRVFIQKALAKKSNYTEAVFFLSQLEAQEGNVREAIRQTEQASLLAPNDISVFFQLGLLKYNDRDNPGAISAFERAIALSPNYSNAKYFLGLSYNRVGRSADAIKQFTDIQALNPDNAEVKSILANLRAGRAAFANTPPPNNTPEKRPKPPIEE